MNIIAKIYSKIVGGGGYNNIIVFKNNKKYVNRKLPKKLKIKGKNNTVILCSDIGSNYIQIYGSNNIVKIGKNVELKCCYIEILCDGNLIEIGQENGEGNYLENLNIHCSNGKNQTIKIGDRTTTNGLNILTMESSKVLIGYNCMFGKGSQIWASDTHTIIDKDTREVINRQKNDLVIGNHCWIGENVKILKNAVIANNTIVGMGSIVAKKYTEENTILAGNPAKVVKTNVDFDRRKIFEYEQK